MPYNAGVASGPSQALQLGDVFESFTGLAAPAAGDYVAIFSRAGGADQRRITWEYDLTGGPPASVQVDLEGNNIDPTVAGNWFSLDSGTTPGGEMRHVVNKVCRWYRLKLVAIGAGGGTYRGTLFEG